MKNKLLKISSGFALVILTLYYLAVMTSTASLPADEFFSAQPVYCKYISNGCFDDAHSIIDTVKDVDTAEEVMQDIKYLKKSIKSIDDPVLEDAVLNSDIYNETQLKAVEIRCNIFLKGVFEYDVQCEEYLTDTFVDENVIEKYIIGGYVEGVVPEKYEITMKYEPGMTNVYSRTFEAQDADVYLLKSNDKWTGAYGICETAKNGIVYKTAKQTGSVLRLMSFESNKNMTGERAVVDSETAAAEIAVGKYTSGSNGTAVTYGLFTQKADIVQGSDSSYYFAKCRLVDTQKTNIGTMYDTPCIANSGYGGHDYAFVVGATARDYDGFSFSLHYRICDFYRSEAESFSNDMGLGSEKWSMVDKTSVESMNEYKTEYLKKKAELSDEVRDAVSDRDFLNQIDRDIDALKNPNRKSFKVLSIGNSFSKDAQAYLYRIAKAAGAKDIVTANLYISGCSLKTHWKNARNDIGAYQYQKNTDGKLVKHESTSILQALQDENWDFITFQQASIDSGMSATYNDDLSSLIQYVKRNRPLVQTKLAWHMTWAYATYFSVSGYEKYNCDQLTMFNRIVSAVSDKIADEPDISLIIASGTAMQNIRTSYIGENITGDGKHLNDIGKYIAGLSFYKSLTGESINNISWLPESSMLFSAYLPAFREAVNNAADHPTVVTASKYKCSHATAPDGIINTLITDPAREATCKAYGLTEGMHCAVCKAVIKAQNKITKPHNFGAWVVSSAGMCSSGGEMSRTCKVCGKKEVKKLPKPNHNFVTLKTLVPATTSEKGSRIAVCTACGTQETQSVDKIKSVSLSQTSFVYNGKVRTPKVTVKDSSGMILDEKKDYTVSYSSGRKSAGKYSVKITFKGDYSGTKVLTYKITPKSTEIKSLKALSKGFKVSWNRQASAGGYIIEYSTSSSFTQKSTKKLTVTPSAVVSKTVGSLAAGKTYYVRIRTYKTVRFEGKNVSVYSPWSAAVKVTTKK